MYASIDEKKAERIRLGRASLEARRQAALELDEMEIDSEDEVDTVGPRRKRDEGDLPYTPESEYDPEAAAEEAEKEYQIPGATGADKQSDNGYTSDHVRDATVPKMTSFEAERQSRFLEGSMRDRVSTRPPPEIIGSVSGSSNSVPRVAKAPLAAPAPKKSRFTFGLGSVFKFNPFSIVDDVKAAYYRQKEAAEERERQKRERAEREEEKREYERQYFEMKRAGAFRPSVPVNDNGRAVTTDDDTAEPWPGSARKRKHREINHPDVTDPEDAPVFSQDSEPEDAASYSSSDNDAPSYPPPPPPPVPAKTPKSSTPTTLLKKTSKIFSTVISTSASKPPTKREVKRQERLLKKVSNLEEQLEKARKELESTGPPVPALPESITSQFAATASNNLMPPPPPPTSAKQPRQQQKYTPPKTEDEDDTTIDEGFSMIPLSPVMANSSFESENMLTQAGINTSPRIRKPTAKALEASMEKEKKKPERKKRRGLESPPTPRGGTKVENPPPVPPTPSRK